ncbi:MAG TPA: cellulase family glycosylhydrolase [Acidimicrobiales bacterium]
MRKGLARWASTLSAAAVLASLILPAATTVAGAASTPSRPFTTATATATSAGGLPWLSVSHGPGTAPQIVDAQGRTVMLRGVNLVGLEDDVYLTPNGQEPGPAPFWPETPSSYDGTCPTNSHQISEPPVCEVQAGLPEYAQSGWAGSENDLAQMRALGFNFVRLPVSWSQLEPTPGTYSVTYIDRIAQVVDWASQQGIHVLIDMHQDNYSRFTPETSPLSIPGLVGPTQQSGGHADGAPQWAVMADGGPALSPLGQSDLNTFVETAFTNFWLNSVPTGTNGKPLPQGAAPGPGLQDHYIGAMAALAQRFKGDSAVAGYEIMNEPLPGLVAAPGLFDQGYLYPFYRRVIDALTGTADGVICPTGTAYGAGCGYRNLGIRDTQHLFFVEPTATRNLTDVALGLSLPFTSYPGIVYAPHAYTHVFTLDTLVPGGVLSGLYPLGYGQAMVTASAEARAMGAAFFIGEFGNPNSADTTILSSETAAMDTAAVGSTLWAWKGNCNPGVTAAACQPGLWSMFEGDASTLPTDNGALIPTRVKYVSRVYPRATAGQLVSFAYTPASGSFTMSAISRSAVKPGARDLETEVYIPATDSGSVRVNGVATLDAVVQNPDGSRLAWVALTGAGTYGVEVS